MTLSEGYQIPFITSNNRPFSHSWIYFKIIWF